MGFDLYGLKPKLKKGQSLPIQPDWEHEPSVTKYFKLQNALEKDNPGIYFRNNCWWWRPLWSYVCDNCGDILTANDMQHGGFNDGHKITKKKAEAIAVKLKELIDKGEVKKYEKKYKKEQDQLPQIECYVCNGTGKRDESKAKPAEMTDSAWSIFKKENKECHCCKGTGKVDAWGKSYPFQADNIVNFQKFCEQSGGFSIC